MRDKRYDLSPIFSETLQSVMRKHKYLYILLVYTFAIYIQ